MPGPNSAGSPSLLPSLLPIGPQKAMDFFASRRKHPLQSLLKMLDRGGSTRPILTAEPGPHERGSIAMVWKAKMTELLEALCSRSKVLHHSDPQCIGPHAQRRSPACLAVSVAGSKGSFLANLWGHVDHVVGCPHPEMHSTWRSKG